LRPRMARKSADLGIEKRATEASAWHLAWDADWPNGIHAVVR
jgi:hypothetical protein